MKTTATVPVRYTFPDGTHEDAELPRELDDFVEQTAREMGVSTSNVINLACKLMRSKVEGVAK